MNHNKLRFDDSSLSLDEIRGLFETFIELDDALNALFFPFLLAPVHAPLLTQDERDSINKNYKLFKTVAKDFLKFIAEAYKQNGELLNENALHRMIEEVKLSTETYKLSKINALDDKAAKKVTVAFRLYDMIVGKFMAATLAASKSK